MGRMNADERGKRDAGLSAWVCRRCAKRRRIESPSSNASDVFGVQEIGVQPQSVLPQVNKDTKGQRKPPPSEVLAVIELDDDIEVIETPAKAVSNEPPPSPPPAPLPSHLPNAPVIQPPPFNARIISELISTMRATGQLEPPPTVDYHFSRDKASRKSSSRRPALEEGHLDSRSRTRDIEDVERKLDDSEDNNAMDDDHPEQQPDADPHNIDDLYGDVAPRYMNERQSARPPRQPAAPDAHLLTSVQSRRLAQLEERDGRQESEPHGQDDARRPRKCLAQRLKGKALRRKQAAGIVFLADEVDWGARKAN